MAASTAFPPRFITSTPTLDATSFVEATMPWRARTGSREAANAVNLSSVGLKKFSGAVSAIKRETVAITRVLEKLFVDRMGENSSAGSGSPRAPKGLAASSLRQERHVYRLAME